MAITPLSSTNIPQNPRRFFAIFVDFCAQNGPKPTQISPRRPYGACLEEELVVNYN
jgi:hypothetical protein